MIEAERVDQTYECKTEHHLPMELNDSSSERREMKREKIKYQLEIIHINKPGPRFNLFRFRDLAFFNETSRPSIHNHLPQLRVAQCS